MNFAIHKTHRPKQTVLVAGERPVGLRGGTSGDWQDAEIVATGAACPDVQGISPLMAQQLAKALGRPVAGTDGQIRKLCRAGDELSIAILVAKLEQERPAREAASKEAARAERARAEIADTKRRKERAASARDLARSTLAEVSAEPGAVVWRGHRYAVESLPAGTVRIDRMLLDDLRAVGISGDALGMIYSGAQGLAARA